MLEEFYLNKVEILKKSQEFFINSSSMIPKIGIELEFFLLEKNLQAVENQALVTDFIAELKAEVLKKIPLIYQIEKEQGVSQIEIKTSFISDLSNLAFELENVKNFVKNFALNKNFIASFASQPFLDDCGNALQFNISLHDKNDKNIFEFDQKILDNAIAGLLEMTDYMMVFLAPKNEDYKRFSLEVNRELFRRGKFSAPVNLSFGADNRTCAIRIPSLKKSVRLEYRIAAADADLFLNISAILLAMFYGIESKLKPEELGFTKIFGNAFDDDYKARSFCGDLEMAKNKFYSEKNFIRDKMLSFLTK